jgi:3-oxoacyl-[acyl-carrier-protein] synthase III
VTDADIYISNLEQALGDPRPMDELSEVQTAGNAAALQADGLRSVRISDFEPWELAARSAERTLFSCGRDSVGAVFYATDSFWSESATVRGPARFLDRLDLQQTPLHGVGFEGCANAGGLIATGADALRAGTAASALCVTTDRAAPGARLMGANVSVLSDGAASFLIGNRRPDSGFRVLATSRAVEAGMHQLDVATDTMAVVKATADGVKRAISSALERTGLEASSISHVVANNYGRTSLKIFCAAGGVPFDLLHRENVAEVGHCFAADTLINLRSLLERELVCDGELCLVLCSGFSNWSATVLEYVG